WYIVGDKETLSKLGLPLGSQNPNPKKLLQRRERSYRGEKKEKLMPLRMGTTLQKMKMSKQTRHSKLKVLEIPGELCEFLTTLYFW
uniref:Uncharacterized protein n=1 Tax=Monodelphis domestica TaxID=13616 RepID=A0A5F8G6X3_MONDO